MTAMTPPEDDSPEAWLSSDEYIRKALNAAPFADNVAGIPEMCALISALQEQRNALRDACVEFCRKVDAGEARSKRSYAQMTLALSKGKSAP
tara:strand:+ start:534 stop:809 length:276 start_codon:yes stop_codon:yes gene_type:complete